MAKDDRKLIPPGDHLTRPEPSQQGISRRDFLKLSTAAAGGLMLKPWRKSFQPRRAYLPEFPNAPHLARAVGDLNVRAKPDINSALVGRGSRG